MTKINFKAILNNFFLLLVSYVILIKTYKKSLFIPNYESFRFNKLYRLVKK